MWKPRLHPKVELTIAQPELPVPLSVVDDRAVVELRRTQSDRVVGRGREQQEVIILQETANQLVIVRRQVAKDRLAGCVIEPLRQLL